MPILLRLGQQLGAGLGHAHVLVLAVEAGDGHAPRPVHLVPHPVVLHLLRGLAAVRVGQAPQLQAERLGQPHLPLDRVHLLLGVALLQHLPAEGDLDGRRHVEPLGDLPDHADGAGEHALGQRTRGPGLASVHPVEGAADDHEPRGVVADLVALPPGRHPVGREFGGREGLEVVKVPETRSALAQRYLVRALLPGVGGRSQPALPVQTENGPTEDLDGRAPGQRPGGGLQPVHLHQRPAAAVPAARARRVDRQPGVLQEVAHVQQQLFHSCPILLCLNWVVPSCARNCKFPQRIQVGLECLVYRIFILYRCFW
mmetsp:Transcript_4624/g.7273  ORF Transcript_4624/g.7273 Transcript_4624/m.7273 type:complete len:313 (-) Transcript_4624:210-1148(-)